MEPAVSSSSPELIKLKDVPLDGSEKHEIPKLSKAAVRALAERVKPVIGLESGKKKSQSHRLTYIEPCDLHEVAYTWDPKPAGEATGLREIAQFECLHSYGYYGLFKPSIAEVLCQIPQQFRERAAAFQIVESPETAADFQKHRKAFDDGFHVSRVVLYEVLNEGE